MGIKALAILALFVTWSNGTFGQSSDSLRALLKNSTGQERIDLLHQLSVNTWLNYPKQAMEYSKEALRLSEELKDSVNIAKSLRYIGAVNYYQGDFETSLNYNIQSLNMALAIKDSVLINNAYNNVGLLDYNMGNYQSALEYFTRSRRIKERIGETYGLATTVNNIGMVFASIQDDERARSYFEEANKIAKETDQSPLEIYTQNNMGISYVNEGQLVLARQYFDNALRRAKEVNNINYGAVALRRIGQVHHLNGQFDSAYFYYQKSLADCETIQDKRGIAEVWYFLAKFHHDLVEEKKALEALNKSQAVATELKVRQQLLDNLKLYSLIHQGMGEMEMGVLYLNKYIELRDSLFLDVAERNLNMIPIKLKEEEDRMMLISQQDEIQESSSTIQLYAIIIVVIIPLVMVLIILLRNNRKTTRQLREKHEDLQKTQKLLVTSEKMASLGVLAAGIGHEFNNPLNFIKNGAAALSDEIKKSENGHAQLQPYFDAIEEGVKRASSVVKSLSHFSQLGVDMDNSCDIHEVIENCLVILNNNIQVKATVVKDFTTESSAIRGNDGKLHQAFFNIISNAEQAIEREGIINITTKLEGKNMQVTISDTGVGIPEEHLLKISDPFFTTKAPGIGVGLGLFVTYSIIEEHGGQIQIKSSTSKGTDFIVTLPLYKKA